MFIVSLTYIRDLNEVDQHLEAHVAYLKKYYALNKFVLSGRKVPRTGGVILVNCTDWQELDAKDPFFQAQVAAYDVTQFVPTMTAPGLEKRTDFL